MVPLGAYNQITSTGNLPASAVGLPMTQLGQMTQNHSPLLGQQLIPANIQVLPIMNMTQVNTTSVAGPATSDPRAPGEEPVSVECQWTDKEGVSCGQMVPSEQVNFHFSLKPRRK